METLIRVIEVFAFVSGLAYIVLEILQKNFMWVVGIATGLACAFSFGVQHVWGQFGLNLYYVAISVVGLYNWRRDSRAVASVEGGGIHLNPLTARTALLSLLVAVAASLALVFVLRALGDSESALDAVVVVLSAIATWWLARSHWQQWLIWIVSDFVLALLCAHSSMLWLAALYMAYSVSAIIGLVHWRRHGVYVSGPAE